MSIHVTRKMAGEMPVVSVLRSVDGHAEILREIEALRPRVADVLNGPPMALRLGFPRDGRFDAEIAFPTASLVHRAGFESKVLPSVPMLAVTHVGPVVGGADGTNLADTRRAFVEYLIQHKVFAGDDPERFIYHEGPETHGDDASRYVTEDLYPYHMPIWLDALAEGTERIAGSAAAARVMAGSERFVEDLDTVGAAAWVPGAIERLDREVPKETDRASILNSCAHHYIVQSAMVMRRLCEQAHRDLRKLVQLITDEPLLGSNYWIDDSGDKPLLMIQRRPAYLEEYEKAKDPLEKRHAACFCPLVRDAIRGGEKVSRTFCHCSAGWYVQEWEVVFGTKPRVDLVDTMLEGADACVFAVHIPPGWL